jgi:hypothetical protein
VRRSKGGRAVDYVWTGIEGIIPPANVRGATAPRLRMSVVECDVPSESALGKTLIESADFSGARNVAATATMRTDVPRASSHV